MAPQDGPASQESAAALFQVFWGELVALLGTPASAAILRRAVKRAAARAGAAELPAVRREGLEYRCSTPDAWRDPSHREGLEQLRRLVREDLAPLCRELTGPVVACRLGQVPGLVAAGLADREEA